MLLAMACASHAPAADDYPNRPIQLVIPFPAGGPADIVGRLYAQHLSALLGQPVATINRDGAAGTIGTDVVARANPDGYTLLFGTTSTMAVNQVIMKKLPYDFIKDFALIGLIVVRLGAVFGRWEYDTGVRDTLSLPLQLLRVAEAGGAAVIHEGVADDWVYSVDVARGLLAVLDLAATPDPVYHLSAGMRWSVEGWCHRLQERFPAFSYRLSAERDECTVGRNNAAPRSPMSIERIRRDAGYAPAYLQDCAFDDYLSRHEKTGFTP